MRWYASNSFRLSNGALNVCYRVTFEDGRRILVRFTAVVRVIARNEKVEDEVAIIKYIADHTTIPAPKALGHGKCAVDPYIVMSFIEGNPLADTSEVHLRRQSH